MNYSHTERFEYSWARWANSIETHPSPPPNAFSSHLYSQTNTYPWSSLPINHRKVVASCSPTPSVPKYSSSLILCSWAPLPLTTLLAVGEDPCMLISTCNCWSINPGISPTSPHHHFFPLWLFPSPLSVSVRFSLVKKNYFLKCSKVFPRFVIKAII